MRRLASISLAVLLFSGVALADGSGEKPSLAATGCQVCLTGHLTYLYSGGSLNMTAAAVQNLRSTTTGTLFLELWATTSYPVFGNTINHFTLGTYTLGQLNGGFEFQNVNVTVPFTPPPDGTYWITMAILEYQGGNTYTYTDLFTFSNQQSFGAPPAGGACHANSTTLCLNGGRFAVSVSWVAVHQGTSGVGQAVSITNDTGYFWFFDSSNVELVVKVLDGRPINGNFWVFYGALTNVFFQITVYDTQTGATRTYQSQQDTQASVSDTSAFAGSGAPQTANLTGTYDGTVTVTSGPQPAAGTQFTGTITLAQTGNQISGTFIAGNGGGGTATGTVTGRNFTFTIQQAGACSGTFVGSGTVSADGRTLTGNYSGSDLCGDSFGAAFSATKR